MSLDPGLWLPTTADEMRARGLGRGRRRLRHRRRLRRSPALRDGDPRPRAGGGRASASRSSASPTGGSCEPWRQFGRPRLFFARQRRQHGLDDQPLHGQQEGPQRRRLLARRPDRPAARPARRSSYCQRCREAFPGVPVIAGGVEASLRRLAHYDYWSDTVRRSILLDCKADLVVYGMGERADRRDRAAARRRARRSTTCATCAAWPTCSGAKRERRRAGRARRVAAAVSYERRRSTGDRQARLRRGDADHPPRHQPAQRRRAGAVPRPPGRRRQPAGAAAQRGGDGPRSTTCRTRAGRIRSYTEPIPAYEMIKDSVTIMRGCFGGCTFCSITAHQGRIIQSRSQESVLARSASRWPPTRSSRASISDIGGPTANMYQMRCTRPEVEAKCQRLSCVHPTICKLLGTDHGPLDRADAARPATSPGVKQGARRPRHPHGPGASRSPEYMRRAGRRTTSAAT